jgi:predicted nicotinamide N-methyase
VQCPDSVTIQVGRDSHSGPGPAGPPAVGTARARPDGRRASSGGPGPPGRAAASPFGRDTPISPSFFSVCLAQPGAHWAHPGTPGCDRLTGLAGPGGPRRRPMKWHTNIALLAHKRASNCGAAKQPIAATLRDSSNFFISSCGNTANGPIKPFYLVNQARWCHLLSTERTKLNRARFSSYANSDSKMGSLMDETVTRALYLNFDAGQRTVYIHHKVGAVSYDLVGHTVWSSSDDLIHLMQQQDLVRGKRVLELGSGTGISGIAAAVLGAKLVVLTDWAPVHQKLSLNSEGVLEQTPLSQTASILSLLHFNVARNTQVARPCDLHVRELQWGNQEHAARVRDEFGRFDVIIGSEVIYTASCAASILDTLPLLMHPRSSAVLMNHPRFRARDYLAAPALAARGLRAAFANGAAAGAADSVRLSLTDPPTD